MLDDNFDGYQGDIPTRLHALFLEVKAWRASNRISLHVSDFTRTILHFEAKSDFPTGRPGLHTDQHVYVFVLYVLRQLLC